MPSRTRNHIHVLVLTLSACGFAAIANPKQISEDSATINGSVVDDAGNPVNDATVFVYSARLKQGYAIVCPTKIIDEISLKISPRGLAPKLVSERPGATIDSIVLTPGATIMGRMVDPDGAPIAHAEVVLTLHDHAAGESLSDMRLGTDNDGSFTFINVPARGIWGIYPTVESLKERNLTASPRWCETAVDQKVINVGKVTLRPGYFVTGKIIMPDKKEIPSGMHVSINSDWDANQLTGIAPNGTFEFSTLAPGIYSLDVGITGYTPTADSPHEILVERNRRDVIISMAPSR